MKIVGIEFKNINSFAGNWDVRFDRPPLSDCGLFAIVGPNGSGKSSILDAMTLGLFGETPRHKNPEERIIPWQADESYAAVTFSVGEDQYRSEWRVKSRAGGLEGPEMRLMELNGGEALLEDRVSRVRSRIAELTGLDFKRFCRSILLAQGEFAEFLAALESERSEILEKIIGPEMKLEMELSIRSSLAGEADKLQQLKETAASITPFDKSRLDQIELEREQLEDELNQVEQTLIELQEKEEWLQRMEQLQDAERNATQKLAEAKALHGELDEQVRLLTEAQAAKPLAEALERLDQTSHELRDIANRLDLLKKDIPHREQRLAELEERLQTSSSELEEARARMDERSQDWSNASLEDGEIELKSQQFRDAIRDFETIDNSRRQMEQRQAELDVELAALNKELRELQQRLEMANDDEDLFTEIPPIERELERLIDIQQQIQKEQVVRAELLKVERTAAKELEKHEQKVLKLRDKANLIEKRRNEGLQRLSDLLENKNRDYWVKLIKASRDKLAVCQELEKIGNQYRKQQASGDALERLQRVESQIEAVGSSLTEEKAQLEEFAEDIRWRDLVKRLDTERSGLQDGDACPLCGSMDHPFTHEGTPDFAELNQIVQAHERKIAGLLSQLNSLDTKAVDLQAQANEAGRLRQLWIKTCEKAGFDWAIPDASLASAERRTQKAVIKDAKSRIRSSRWQNWKNGRMERTLLRKETRLGRSDAIADEVGKRYRLEQQALAAVDGKIESLQREDGMLRDEVTGWLADHRERSPAPGSEASLLLRLKDRAKDYRLLHDGYKTKTERLQSLESEKLALSDELLQLQQDATTLTQEIEGLQASLTKLKADRAALFGSMDPTGERAAVESKIAGCLKEQAELKQEIGSWQKQLIEDQTTLIQLSEQEQKLGMDLAKAQPELEARAAEVGFASLDQVRESMAMLQNEQRLLEQHHAAKQTLADTDSQEAATRNELEMVRTERKTEESIMAIRQRLIDNMKDRDSLQTKKNAFDRLLLEQAAAERETREIQAAIAEQEKVWAAAAAEQSRLEATDDPEIRNRLQRLMLDRLIEHSNQYLATLSDRYRLSVEGQNGFGFLVRDTHQAKTHRSTSTLSGGETFLVSLCLALGLSEIACKQRKIESLFIDEGFGALDDENLYSVIKVLKGLRNNGKMVGIISHVKRMANEIPTQIRVEKQLGGMSRLTITA